MRVISMMTARHTTRIVLNRQLHWLMHPLPHLPIHPPLHPLRLRLLLPRWPRLLRLRLLLPRWPRLLGPYQLRMPVPTWT